MVLTFGARKEQVKRSRTGKVQWGRRQWWVLKWCVSEAGCSEAGCGWLLGQGPLPPSSPNRHQNHRCLRGTISYWNFLPLENFIQLSFSLVHSEPHSSGSRKAEEPWRMWFAPGDSNQCLRIHEKFLSWKLFFKSLKLWFQVLSQFCKVLSKPSLHLTEK